MWTLLGREDWPTVDIMQPKLKGGEMLNWVLIDRLCAWENALHSKATVGNSTWDEMFHIWTMASQPPFGNKKQVVDWNSLLDHLVPPLLPLLPVRFSSILFIYA